MLLRAKAARECGVYLRVLKKPGASPRCGRHGRLPVWRTKWGWTGPLIYSIRGSVAAAERVLADFAKTNDKLA